MVYLTQVAALGWISGCCDVFGLLVWISCGVISAWLALWFGYWIGLVVVWGLGVLWLPSGAFGVLLWRWGVFLMIAASFGSGWFCGSW